MFSVQQSLAAVPLYWKLPASASLSLLLWSLCFSSNQLVYFKCSPGRHHEIVLELLRSICLKPGTYCSRMLSRLWNIKSKFSCSSSASARPVWKSTSFLWTMSAITIIFLFPVTPHGLQLKSIPLHVLSTVVFSLACADYSSFFAPWKMSPKPFGDICPGLWITCSPVNRQ